MDIGLMQTIWTIIVMVLFIGIFIWAWSGRNKKSFDDASRIPMNDDKPLNESIAPEGENHG